MLDKSGLDGLFIPVLSCPVSLFFLFLNKGVIASIAILYPHAKDLHESFDQCLSLCFIFVVLVNVSIEVL